MQGKSFRELKALYAALDPPESVAALWRGKLVGPGWFATIAGPALAGGGLGIWWGTEFDDQGGIDDILERRALSGGPCLARCRRSTRCWTASPVNGSNIR